MDRLIKRYEAVEDDDLMLCREHGVAYQKDITPSRIVKYDRSYFEHYKALESGEIAEKINAGRIAVVNKYVGNAPVLDTGIGSGQFIMRRQGTFGRDVNPVATEWLKKHDKEAGDITSYRAFTFWDVIEHVPDIDIYFRRIPSGSFLFTCLPIFKDLNRIRESKHYKPDEHLYYWTRAGFVEWMSLYGFELLEEQDFETAAGRDSIKTFVFSRMLPGYGETIAQYQKMYENIYGASASMYLEYFAPYIIADNPRSILDYGCGYSDLLAYFWNDGKRYLCKYDPAIPKYKQLPSRRFDMVICCDVMEHVLMHDVDRVLLEMREKAAKAIFAISTRPARAHLPDGRNAHVTLLTKKEWRRWVEDYFGATTELSSPWPDQLLVKNF